MHWDSCTPCLDKPSLSLSLSLHSTSSPNPFPITYRGSRCTCSLLQGAGMQIPRGARGCQPTCMWHVANLEGKCITIFEERFRYGTYITSVKVSNILIVRLSSSKARRFCIWVPWWLLTLKGQCKPHGLGIILGESCSKLLLHCTKWGF